MVTIDLHNMPIFITGALGGIGQYLVQTLDRAGATLLPAGTNVPRLEKIASFVTRTQIRQQARGDGLRPGLHARGHPRGTGRTRRTLRLRAAEVGSILR
jgi:NAD(P)-dependent dehydrogenase (short-subunit alcohol dehydrogenase family)